MKLRTILSSAVKYHSSTHQKKVPSPILPLPLSNEVAEPTCILTPNLQKCTLRVISSFFRNPHRNEEFEHCLKRNASLNIEQHLVCEDDESERVARDLAPNAVIHRIEKRPTFADMIRLVQKDAAPNTLFGILNSDIELTEEIEYLQDFNFSGKSVCLARWERNKTENALRITEFIKRSQDAWFWKDPIHSETMGQYCLGVRGCDHRFVYELIASGRKCIELGQDILSIHHHADITRVASYFASEVGRPYGNPAVERIRYSPLIPRPSHISSLTGKRVFIVAYPGQLIQKAFSSVGAETHFFDATHHKFQQKLQHQLELNRPHLVFLQLQGAPISIPILQKLKRAGASILNWTGDARVPLPQWYLDMAPHVTMTLFSNDVDTHTLRSRGFRSDFLNIGYDPHVYTPFGDRLLKPYDVTFMGSNYETIFELGIFRKDMVTRLYDTFGDGFGLFGYGWDRSAGECGKDPQREAKIYRSSKMAISLSHYDLQRYFSDRMFRLMGCGTLCLVKSYPGLEIDFTDGENVVVWKTLDELCEKIRYYLEHPQERLRIAKKGAELVEAKHTWYARMANIHKFLA
jgi:hypothetical protein